MKDKIKIVRNEDLINKVSKDIISLNDFFREQKDYNSIALLEYIWEISETAEEAMLAACVLGEMKTKLFDIVCNETNRKN